jgi:chromosome segregation ATPase
MMLDESSSDFSDMSGGAVAQRFDELELAEKSGEINDEPEDITNDDKNNEFLNSSSFLSHSQIIRSTNVANFKPSKPNSMSSPTRRDPTEGQDKEHFQLFSRDTSSRIPSKSDQSDFDDYDDGDLGVYDDEKTSVSSSDRKSTKFIDIDDPKSTPKLPKMHPDTTPWRRLRPLSSMRVKEVPEQDVLSMNYVQSLFDSNPTSAEMKSPQRSVSLFEMGDTVLSSAGSASDIEHLRKQITNYKLQQRILTEVIREILKRSGNGDLLKSEIMHRLEEENGFLLNQHESLQRELKRGESQESEKYNEKVKEVLDLKNDLIATTDLNKELQSYIDDLKAQIIAQERAINSQADESESWTELADKILSILLRYVEGESFKAVQKARDSSTSLNTKLNVIKLAVNELGQKYDVLSIKVKGVNDENRQFAGQLKHDLQDKLSTSKSVQKELAGLLNQQSGVVSSLKSELSNLQHQLNESIQFSASLKKLLQEKRQSIKQLNEYILSLETEVGELSQTKAGDKTNEATLLKNRLTIVKTNHSKEIEKLRNQIEQLHIDLDNKPTENFKNLQNELAMKENEITNLNNVISSLNGQLLDKSHEVNSLDQLKKQLQTSRDEYDSLLREYRSLRETIKGLQERELVNEKEYKRKLDHAGRDLNIAVTKQRTLAAEKSKLTFALEDSKRERSTLTLNNNTLTEKVTRLSYQISTLTSYEVGFKSLLSLQAQHLKNMLTDFEPILEKSSVMQAYQKLEKLTDSQMDFEMTHSIVRSLFAFFENAMESLISDHSELLMKRQDNELKGENEELKRQIAELRDELDSYDHIRQEDLSPRSKLRVSDLEAKRKAERERRKLEFEESKKQVIKLQNENKILKEKMEKLSRPNDIM